MYLPHCVWQSWLRDDGVMCEPVSVASEHSHGMPRVEQSDRSFRGTMTHMYHAQSMSGPRVMYVYRSKKTWLTLRVMSS